MDDGVPPPRNRGGRPSKYDWVDKRDICYKLYVEEQRTLDDITQYFAHHFNVAQSDLPCRRSFLRQFRLWAFPTHHRRQLDPNEEVAASARIKELWEQNVAQKDIKTTLADEGFELQDYDFAKLWRKKLGLRLRNDNGFKEPDGKIKQRKRRAGAIDEYAAIVTPGGGEDAGAGAHTLPPISAPLDPEAAALRAQRLSEIQAESDQKMHDKKRRRRIRGYAHLPPDAAGTEPRYNSETSLDECKAILHLSNEMYQTVRNDYEKICRELGIIKKTMCADGVWEGSKQRLIRENIHLTAMTHQLQPDQDKKAIALDVIASDVTKRMRTAEKALTIAEANNLLGLNPSESKAIRRAMYETLANGNFESTLINGTEHYQTLKQSWIDSNGKLQAAMGSSHEKLTRAVDLLCSDARKRYREDRNKRGERLVVQRNSNYGPGPGPAWAPRWKNKNQAMVNDTESAPVDAAIREPHIRAAVVGRGFPRQQSDHSLSNITNSHGDIMFDLDPALSNPSLFAPMPSAGQPIPAYFRLAPSSRVVGHHPKMWLGKLTSPTIASLHTAATSKVGATMVSKTHGIVKNSDGTEDSWLIDNDAELGVYLSEAGEKASFAVELQGSDD